MNSEADTHAMNLTRYSGATPLPASMPWTARTVLGLLRRLQHGRLDLQTPNGEWLRFGPGLAGQPHAAISLTSWNSLATVLRHGDIGFAESYIAGEWTTPDLVALLRLAIVNRDQIESLVYGSRLGNWFYRLRHLLNRNTRAGSRRNIHAHYDLGNAFYKLWLDPSMNYSSAWFDGDTAQDTTSAQQAKMRRALRQVDLRPGMRLLEVGCGWGALAECAAREFDARVTGVTLSTEQLDYARARLASRAPDAQADLRLLDYRDIADAPFDAIVSIEMFEAVGHAYWPSYFKLLHDKLAPGGRACVQSITIRDELFDRYLGGTDFIQQYIFPGGMLPSRGQFRQQATQAGLTVVDELAFGIDYAETLRRWRAQFLRQEAMVLKQGFDRRFLRIWDFYLAYCEAAFATGQTDVVQFTLQHR
jgi:cyclopropane-fatty-acyl-phospholipid synthase